MRLLKEFVPMFLAALALVLYIESKEAAMHDDLNALGKAQCEGNAKVDPIGHYNQLVDALVKDYQERKRENLERGDTEKAVINASTISALKAALIEIPPADCNKPLLP